MTAFEVTIKRGRKIVGPYDVDGDGPDAMLTAYFDGNAQTERLGSLSAETLARSVLRDLIREHAEGARL